MAATFTHGFHSLPGNHVSKILHLGLGKETFRHFQNKMIVQQHLKSGCQVAQMSLEGGAINEYVIEEDNDELSEIWPEN